MTLEELRTLCAGSSPADWNAITCWGGGGPSYLEAWDEETAYQGQQPHTRVRLMDQHSMRASYIPDLSVGLAWGITVNDDFQEDWANQFPDPKASGQVLDILVNGMLAEREFFVVVDGGRCMLPLPKRDGTKWTITRWQYDFFSTVDALEKASDFGRYVGRAGLEVV